MSLFPDIDRKLAVESDCKRYRFLLRRELLTGEGTCTFILLNPSTADAVSDDPTTRRCIAFAKDWGYKRLQIVNLFAYRATKPRDLLRVTDYDTAVGISNDSHILKALGQSDLVVCGWGNHGKHLDRSSKVQRMLKSMAIKTSCFLKTNQGEPMHPLYVPSYIPLDLL